MTQKFYVDSCIWLNLFKKEEKLALGIPVWKRAKDFIEMAMYCNDSILYTEAILKELKYNINNQKIFEEKLKFFKGESTIKFEKLIQGDYDFAKKLESESDYIISLYDCLHIAICKRLKAILVTRDNELIKFAQKFIKVNKPENLDI